MASGPSLWAGGLLLPAGTRWPPAKRSGRPLPAAAPRRPQLYASVWSQGNVHELDTIMAADHSQRDMIWQPDRVGGGRERMQASGGVGRPACWGLAGPPWEAQLRCRDAQAGCAHAAAGPAGQPWG
jgi:hypothetical protein